MKAIPFTAVVAGAVLLASPALADQGADQGQGQGPGSGPPAAAPTVTVMATPSAAPGPVLATGGNVSSSNPGSGCSSRLGIRNAPLPPSNIYLWNASGDSGWPFGWPGMAPNNAYPTTPPSVGCSR
ncbi:MAG TPA: hypothetical protein VFB19_19400 [Mycobacterium sp.]|nr:hypothetical protein [Mycobacterium sp.]